MAKFDCPLVSDEALAEFKELVRRDAEARKRRQATCDHAGYSFKTMGRCCFACGTFMVDWGD